MNLKPGLTVRITDGQPKPPARFNKKLREWEGRNYLAVLIEDEGTRYAEEGSWRFRMYSEERLIGYIQFHGHRAPSCIIPIPGLPLVPVNGEDRARFEISDDDFRTWVRAVKPMADSLIGAAFPVRRVEEVAA